MEDHGPSASGRVDPDHIRGAFPLPALRSGNVVLLPGRDLDTGADRRPVAVPGTGHRLNAPAATNVYYPKDTGGFFNYGVAYTAGNSLHFEELDVAGEIGLRTGDYLFYTDSTYTHTRTDDWYVRLTSNVTYDRRAQMQRAILGDFQASSGLLGSNLLLGGASFSKVYRIDPYFLYYPLAGFAGQVPFPSVAEVYLDGNRIRTEKLSPGGTSCGTSSITGGCGTSRS